MSYSAEISRVNPSCFLFIIDQSGSMGDQFIQPGFEGRTKADFLADTINKVLTNIVIRSTKTEETPWDYFHIGVLGYGATVGPAFAGSLSGKSLIPVSEIAENPARIEERAKKVSDGAGGLVDQNVKFPIWFESVANGGTPMTQAMTDANGILSSWLAESEHQDCFPPVVIHISDGESTDGDPSGVMTELGNLTSSDGNVILFNIHVSSSDTGSIKYPNSSEGLPDQYAQMLFDTAGHLTPFMIQTARNEYGFEMSDDARAYIFNASPDELVAGLDIGTRPTADENLR